MKRLFSFLLILILAMGIIPAVAMAAENPDVSLTTDVTSVTAGNVVTVTLTLEHDLENVMLSEFFVHYDTSLFTRGEATLGNAITGTAVSAKNVTADGFVLKNDGTDAAVQKFSVNAFAYPGGAAAEAGTIVTIKFTARADVTDPVAAAFVLEFNMMQDSEFRNIPIAVSEPITVTVTCNHEWEDATCEHPKTCTKCQATEGKPLDHTPETIPAVPPTCTENGLTEGVKCSACDTVITAQQVDPAKGHPDEDRNYSCDVCGTALCTQHSNEVIPAVAPTCTENGLTEGVKCSICGDILTAQTVIPAKGHTDETIPAVAPTCTKTGLTAGVRCSVCGTVTTAQTVVPATGHTPQTIPAVAPTCTETGLTAGVRCSVCDTVITAQAQIPAIGHNYLDGVCTECGAGLSGDVPPSEPTEPQPTEPQPTEPQPTEPEPTDPSEPSEPEETEPTEPEPSEPAEPVVEGIIRLAGKDRYLTGFAVANQLKEMMDTEKFEAVVIAYGQNFPDALTGSYLASVKNAPILLTETSVDGKVLEYLQENLAAGGQVYILGGTAAVSQSFEDGAKAAGFNVKRLKGAGRYETNLAILAEAGVNQTDEILIATGKNYADSLSASATGLPMVLVDQELTQAQKTFLEGTSKRFVILGGTGAVSAEIEAELAEMGTVVRIKGASRYGTSVAIAQRYFTNPSAAVLAYGEGFPDGLCGGPLALAMGAPLILTSDKSPSMADDYVQGITSGAVTGGSARISDETVRDIFDLAPDAPIVKK